MKKDEKNVSFKFFITLLIVALTSTFIGKAITAYFTEEDLDITLMITFLIVGFVSFVVAFWIASPKCKKISLKRFLMVVLPLFLMFIFISGFFLI